MPSSSRPVATIVSTVACAALLAIHSAPAGASGGLLKRFNDGTHSGVVATFSNSTADDRFMQEYPANLLGKGAIVCAGRVEHRSTADLGSFTNFELRWEDPTNPGYCDLSPAGLIATADPSSIGSCNSGDNVTLPTFGNGAGVAVDSGSAFYFTAILPIQTTPDCGILVDTNNPDYHRGKVYDSATGTFFEAAGNLMLDVFVSEPGYFNFSVSMRGRQRYPGDPGIPMMFARRANTTSPFPQTDDFISATLVYDNFIPAPVTREFTMEIDRSSLSPNLSYRYIPLFRIAGTSFPLNGPTSVAPGRTRLGIEVPRALPDSILPVLPLNMRFRARVWDPDFATGSPTSVHDVLGLRPAPGVLDDGTLEAYTLARSPGNFGDAMAVRFRAVDMPRSAPYAITGIAIVGFEAGGSGLLGFDALEIRRDDFLLSNTADMTMPGLLASFGTLDGVGEVPAPGLRILDIPDVAIDPTASRTNDLWAIVYERPGDRTSSGTALGLDTTADTLLQESFTLIGGQSQFRAVVGNFMIRLLLDGAGSTLDGGHRVVVDEDAKVRDLSTYEVIDYRRR